MQKISLIDEEIVKLKRMKEKIEQAYKKNQEINKYVLETSEKLGSFFGNNFMIRRKFNELEIDQTINLEHNIISFYKISKDIFVIGC